MQPFIKFIADNSFIKRGAEDATYSQVVGSWKADCESAFRGLSLAGKCKHLVRQALMVNFVYRVYHKEPWFLFTEYRDQLLRWVDEINGNTGENDPMIAMAIRVTKMLLNAGEENTFLYPSLQEMEVYLDPSSDTEPIPRIGERGFYIPYAHFVIKTAAYKEVGKGHAIDKADKFSHPLAAVPMLNFFDNYVLIEYVPVAEYKFDPELLNDTKDIHGKFFKSFYGYLLCMDWSEKQISQILALISNYALVLDTNAINQNNVAMVYNKLRRTIFEYAGNIPANIVCDALHVKELISFILILRKEKKVEVDEPQLLAAFIKNGNSANLTEDEKLLVDYFSKVKTDTETSLEEFQAFKRSVFGDFDELAPSVGE